MPDVVGGGWGGDSSGEKDEAGPNGAGGSSPFPGTENVEISGWAS